MNVFNYWVVLNRDLKDLWLPVEEDPHTLKKKDHTPPIEIFFFWDLNKKKVIQPNVNGVTRGKFYQTFQQNICAKYDIRLADSNEIKGETLRN